MTSPCVLLLVAFTFLVLLSLHFTTAITRPHIVVIMADDLGWNDVGFRNPELHSPNIDKMAAEGVTMNYTYMNQVCTPSRAAFMTGVYPFKMGLQNSVLSALENSSMPLKYTLLPERLKKLGYATHMVGKWHLGFCNYNMTPTRRGFDTFYGMYLGKGGYYDHTSKWDGYDLQDNNGSDPDNWRTAWEGKGKYATQLFTDRSLEIINKHNTSTPLFLFLSHQSAHGPLEAPDKYIASCSNITDNDTRVHCAMVAAMDEGMGQISKALDDRGMSDNLITLFISDNGGPVKLASSNWPLRGAKITLWEGGTRVVSILHSKKYLTNAPYTWNGLMHAVDWVPTLLRAAKETSEVTDIDGVNNWLRIKGNKTSNRDSFVYNIDDVKNTRAIRYNNHKLVFNKPGKPQGWYNPSGGGDDEEPDWVYPDGGYMLFDIEEDPEERHDLSNRTDKQTVMTKMKDMLKEFQKGLVATPKPNKPEAGKPKYHNGSWVSGWC